MLRPTLRQLAAICGLQVMILLPAQALAYTATFSIRPLAGIGEAIADGTSIDVDLVLSEPVSPHSTTLRPSHVRKIAQGQLVMVVDRGFETFLSDALDTYAPGKTIEASKLPGVGTASRRSFNPIHTDRYGIVIPPTFPANNTDYHLWLDPDNALAIAADLRDRFSKASPLEADKFAANYAGFEKKIADARQAVTKTLLPVVADPFIVYHDSYQYFDRAFDLRQSAMISQNDTDEIGPTRLEDLNNLLDSTKMSCVFYDPEEGVAYTKKFAAAHGLKAAEVDPLGQHLPLDADFYPKLLESVAGAFADCLKQG